MKKRNEKGIILVFTLLAIALMSTLFIGSLLIITTDLEITKNYYNSKEALYLAEAGIENALAMLRQNYQWDQGFSKKEFPSNSGNTYTVTIENNYPFVTIDSISTVKNTFQKHLVAKVSICGPPYNAPYIIRIDNWQEL